MQTLIEFSLPSSKFISKLTHFYIVFKIKKQIISKNSHTRLVHMCSQGKLWKINKHAVSNKSVHAGKIQEKK